MSDTSTLRAWDVTDWDYTYACIVFAHTAGQAKMRGAQELDREFTEVRAKRAPRFDDLAGITRAITAHEYLDRGWTVFCDACISRGIETRVYDDEAVRTDDGGALCPECGAKAAA